MNIIKNVRVSRQEVELPRTLFCSSYNTTVASQNRVSECALRIELHIHTHADYCGGTTSLAGSAVLLKHTSGLNVRMIYVLASPEPQVRVWGKIRVYPDAFSNST